MKSARSVIPVTVNSDIHRSHIPELFKPLIAGLLATGFLPAAQAIDTVWFGGTGNWELAGNWSVAQPGAGDVAVINAGIATLGFDTSIQGLTQGGGALTGAGGLTLTGVSTWTAGSQGGTGSTTFDNNLAISGPNLKVIVGGRVLNLNGVTAWSGNTANNNNALRFWNGATINNNLTFNDANAFDSFIEHNVGGPHNFNNIGTYNKQSNTVTLVDFGVAFNNTGTVNVNAGTFRPAGGGTSSGSFNIAAGATLDFRDGNHVLNDVTTSGAGLFQISTDNVGADATVTLNGGTHTTPFLLSGSTLTGTAHIFQGAANWTGGTITGAATASTTFANTLTISGPIGKSISGGRAVNAGNTTWAGNTGNNNNAIAISGASIFNNTGTFTDANAFDSIINRGNGGGTFNNSGTFNKQSNTTTSTGVAFNNTGTVNVNAGTFLPGGGGTSTGVFNIANGARLEFRNGNHSLNNATTSGLGTLQISTENVGADAVVAINGGTHTTPFLLSGSALTGTDHVFQGPVTWTGGAISGVAGTSGFDSTTFINDVTISGASTKTLVGGRVLNLEATTTWSGNTANNNNAIRFWNGAMINNNGTFNDTNAFNSFFEHNVGGPHNFNNVGTYNKQSNTVTTFDLGVALNNTGTTNVNAGTMQVISPFTNNGVINTAAGASFFGSSATFVNAGTLAGNGTFATHVNGDIVNQGAINPGTSIGHLTLDGDLMQTASGRLNFELLALSDFDVLTVTDDVTLAGTIVALNAGYVPVVGDSFVVLTFDQRLGGSMFNAVTTQGYGPGIVFEAIYNLHDVTLRVAAVPEAETWALMLAGLGLVGVAARRRARMKTASIFP